MLAPQMRIVPLTPMLPLATPIDDELSRQTLFLAFKAASIVLAKIQTDVSRLVQEALQGTLQEIPFATRALPSVTEIQAIDQSLQPIEFTLLRRHDTTVDYRNLYHARMTSTGKEIYIKFTRQYSRVLHLFCSQRGLAPNLLGFQQLPGGWFALAMEKVDVVDLSMVDSFPERLGIWKQKIRKLVDDFHQEDLVHGDLRLANFIFTNDSPCRMLLVDFDWGGKAAEVCFPRGELAEDLRVEGGQDDRLDRPITKEDDDRVLAVTFKRLDNIRIRMLEAAG